MPRPKSRKQPPMRRSLSSWFRLDCPNQHGCTVPLVAMLSAARRVRCPRLFAGALIVTLCWLADSWVGLAQPRLGDEVVASPLVWRAFRPAVIALGDRDRERAISYLRASDVLLRKADGPIERDAPTMRFQTRALASLADFDLKDFFELLPERDGPYHAFAFSGVPLERGYRFEVGKGSAFEVNATSARRGFGEASGVVRMRHVEADNKFRYLLAGARRARRRSARRGPRSAPAREDFVDWLGEHADYMTIPLLLQTADSQLKHMQPALHEEDRRVLASLWGSFPEVSRLLSSVSSVDDVLVARPDTRDSRRFGQVTQLPCWDLPRHARGTTHSSRSFSATLASSPKASFGCWITTATHCSRCSSTPSTCVVVFRPISGWQAGAEQERETPARGRDRLSTAARAPRHAHSAVRSAHVPRRSDGRALRPNNMAWARASRCRSRRRRVSVQRVPRSGSCPLECSTGSFRETSKGSRAR